MIDSFLVSALYFVILLLLGILIGFSPILYGMMMRFSLLPQAKRRHLSLALVIGVAAGVVAMFLMGSGIAVAIQHAYGLIGRHGRLHYESIAMIGLIVTIYALVQLYVPRRKKQSLQKRTTTKNIFLESTSLGLFSFTKTILSVSSVGAVMFISAAIASRDLSSTVILFVIVPIVCFLATMPFIVLANGEHWAPWLYKRITTAFTFMQTVSHNNRVVALRVLMGIGVLLVIYAIAGLR